MSALELQDIRLLFPAYDSLDMEAEWGLLQDSMPVGQRVEGRVVLTRHNLELVDLGLPFPGLLELVRTQRFWLTENQTTLKPSPCGSPIAAWIIGYEAIGDRRIRLTEFSVDPETIRYMSKEIDAIELHSLFPGYKSPDCQDAWSGLLERTRYNAPVEGSVVLDDGAGIFLDVGAGFPYYLDCLNMDVSFRRIENNKLLLPPIGTKLKARVRDIDETGRVIEVTQVDFDPLSKRYPPFQER